MTTRTRLEVIHQVLDNLGVLVPGQSPAAEDVGKIDGVFDAIVEKLRAMEITYIADPGTGSPPNGGAIEAALFMPLAAYIAYECASMFNMAGDAQLKVEALRAEDELEQIGRPPRARKTLQPDLAVRGQHRRGIGTFSRGT